jgi:branched-chain amino acid transport system substrate-binding protein
MRKITLMTGALLCAATLSCSRSRFAYTPCTTNQQCRDAFGWGHVCEEQLCAEVSPQPRCTETYPPDLIQRKAEFQDAIIIGMQFDESAFEAEMDAAELAVRQVMKNEGLDGRSYGLVKCSNEESSSYDALDQDEANVLVSEYLANEIGAVAIIGPGTSDRVDAAFLAVEPYGTMLMSPTARSPSLTHLDGLTSSYDDPGLLWRTAPPDNLQGEVLAQFMASQGDTSVAVIVEEGPYGTALGVVFAGHFERDGNTVDQLTYESNNADSLADQIDSAASASVDAVLFISATEDDITEFLTAVATSGFSSKNIYLADGAKDTVLFEDIPGLEASELERIFGTAPAPASGQVYQNFKDDYQAKYNRPADQTPYTAFAYDAAWLVIYGTAWSYYNEGLLTGLGVARGLRMISSGSEIDIGPSQWNSLKAQFKEGQTVNVRGASGELDYDSETGETSTPIDVWGVEYDESGNINFPTLETYEP